MRIDIAGLSIDSTLLIILLGIVAGAIVTKLLLDMIIKNVFATYPEDTKESLRFIIDILVIYICITLILYALISNYIILLAMFMAMAGIILDHTIPDKRFPEGLFHAPQPAIGKGVRHRRLYRGGQPPRQGAEDREHVYAIEEGR